MSIIDSLGLDMISLTTKRIGEIDIAVTFEEAYSDELTITEHPVENGANISDHAIKRPREVVIKCGWSNADYAALLGTSAARLLNGYPSNGDYVNSIYSQLISLQESREPMTVVTSRRMYNNMLIGSLTVVNDMKTTGALMCTATLREIIIVSTRATTLPPRENQADPSKTAEIENTGTKQVRQATPSPGGSVSIPGL